MTLSNFTRPSIPYTNAPLPNDNRFSIITRVLKKPITPDQLDGEFNKLTDNDNILDNKIEAVVAGNIPGSDQPVNANKFLTTDGAGTLSFVKVTNNNIDDGALDGKKTTPGTIGTEQLDNGIITPDKVPDDSIPYSKMDFEDGDIPYPKINVSDGAIAYPKLNIPDEAIPYPKINVPDGAIAYPKLNIPDTTIPGSKLVGKSIAQAQQGLLSVGTPELIDGCATTGKIANAAVTTQKINDGAVNDQKLQNAGQMVPFAIGYIRENATILKQKNISSVVLSQVGQFDVAFSTPASNENYIVTTGLESGDSRTIAIYNGTKTTNGFSIRTFQPNGTLASQSFNFIVYSF